MNESSPKRGHWGLALDGWNVYYDMILRMSLIDKWRAFIWGVHCKTSCFRLFHQNMWIADTSWDKSLLHGPEDRRPTGVWYMIVEKWWWLAHFLLKSYIDIRVTKLNVTQKYIIYHYICQWDFCQCDAYTIEFGGCGKPDIATWWHHWRASNGNVHGCSNWNVKRYDKGNLVNLCEMRCTNQSDDEYTKTTRAI